MRKSRRDGGDHSISGRGLCAAPELGHSLQPNGVPQLLWSSQEEERREWGLGRKRSSMSIVQLHGALSAHSQSSWNHTELSSDPRGRGAPAGTSLPPHLPHWEPCSRARPPYDGGGRGRLPGAPCAPHPHLHTSPTLPPCGERRCWRWGQPGLPTPSLDRPARPRGLLSRSRTLALSSHLLPRLHLPS